MAVEGVRLLRRSLPNRGLSVSFRDLKQRGPQVETFLRESSLLVKANFGNRFSRIRGFDDRERASSVLSSKEIRDERNWLPFVGLISLISVRSRQ